MQIQDHFVILLLILGTLGFCSCVLFSGIILFIENVNKNIDTKRLKEFLTGLLLFSTLCFIVVLCNDWLDVLTGKVHHYDSRRKDNVEHFSMPCYLFDQKRNSVNLDLFFSLDSFKSICKDLEI